MEEKLKNKKKKQKQKKNNEFQLTLCAWINENSES